MALYRPLRLDGGEDPSFEYPEPINANADGLAAFGFYPQNTTSFDTTVGVDRDVGNRLILHDSQASVPLVQAAREIEFAEVDVDTTNSLLGWQSLLKLETKLREGHRLLALAVVNFSNSSTNTSNYFRILVDDHAIRSAGARYINAPAAAANVLVCLSGLIAGTHTVTLEWRRASGICRIRPVTAPDSESCSLLVLGL